MTTTTTLIDAILDRIADLPPIAFATVVLPLALAPMAAAIVLMYAVLTALA